jgi:tetratricopeptide (TPR) repeat protein
VFSGRRENGRFLRLSVDAVRQGQKTWLVDERLRTRLAGQISRGSAMLFTGAGFSMAARNRDGENLPSTRQLRDDLWEIAFPGTPVDERSSLGDTYAVAVRQHERAVGELLRLRLDADPRTLPGFYETWFAMPWTRVFTVNLDTLHEAVDAHFATPRRLEIVSGFDDASAPTEVALQCVHLNGRLADFPETTFSFRQYGDRTAARDYWYHHLVRQMNGQAVVFVGTELDEPPLWQHLQLRGARGRRLRELRPGSYLVSPTLAAARAAMLAEFNIAWVQMDAETFAEEVLAGMREASEQGHRSLVRRGAPQRADRLLRAVGELRLEPASDTREFLWGREPVWGDFGDAGYAILRAFEPELVGELQTGLSRLVLLTGTAGAGKSSALMRLGLTLDATGQDVRWLNVEGETTIGRIRAAVGAAPPDVLLIDDLDVFGSSAGRLLVELIEDSPNLRVAAAVRSSRYERLELGDFLHDQPAHETTVPHLADSDIDDLLDALTAAGRLGELRGMTRAQQVRVFRGKANRQLIVAMIEATTNRRFDEKIESECRDLGAESGLLYAVVAVATMHRHGLTRQEVLLAAGDASNTTLNRLQGLIDRHLLVIEGDLIRVRHRVIAERAVEWFRQQHQLAEPIGGLLFAMATQVAENYRLTRPGRVLVRTMSHTWLRQMLADDRVAIREIYDDLQPLMDWDYHYWLQRGSFEVEVGDIELAENFLEQARSLAPEDYRVQTEWAYMTLVRATQDAQSVDSAERAESAFAALEEAIERRGDTDAYPFHVMGRQGLLWLQESSTSQEEKITLLTRLRWIANEGLRLHPSDAVLRQLQRDLETAYLSIAAMQADGF